MISRQARARMVTISAVSAMTSIRSDNEAARADMPALFRAGPLLPVLTFVVGSALDYVWPLHGIGAFGRSFRMILAGLAILLGLWLIRAGNAAFRRANA